MGVQLLLCPTMSSLHLTLKWCAKYPECEVSSFLQ
jgi:hypothetical protein